MAGAYDWLLKGGGTAINPLDNAYFGTEQRTNLTGGRANGGNSIGDANGAGFMNWSQIPGAEQFIRHGNGGDSDTGNSLDSQGLSDWMQANGYTLKDSGVNGGTNGYRWIQDANGQIVGAPSEYSNDDSTFKLGAMAAAAIAGGGIIAAQGAGAAGGGLSGMDLAADAALGTGNNITTAGGLLSGAPAAVAPVAGEFGSGLTAETAAGLTSPGAAGSGGALLTSPGAASTLPSWLPKGLEGVWDVIKTNPKIVGALAGGLLGGAGSSGTDEPAPYTGPMPTITRGAWNPAASGYKPMQATQYGGGLLNTPGTKQAASGLHQYMGLLGR